MPHGSATYGSTVYGGVGGADISGVVTDQNNDAVSNTTVVAVDQSSGTTYSTTTQSDGSYSLSPGSGTYNLYTSEYQSNNKPFITVS